MCHPVFCTMNILRWSAKEKIGLLHNLNGLLMYCILRHTYVFAARITDISPGVYYWWLLWTRKRCSIWKFCMKQNKNMYTLLINKNIKRKFQIHKKSVFFKWLLIASRWEEWTSFVSVILIMINNFFIDNDTKLIIGFLSVC